MATITEVVWEGIKAPSGLEFKQSQMEPTLMGVWAKKGVRKGRTYGPFVGEKKPCSEVLDDTYSWEIRGPKGVRLYSIDASEPSKGNWMRYVKSARSFEEQNMIATQYKRSIYYRTLRNILPGEELMCWYKSLSPDKDSDETTESDSALNVSGDSITSAQSDGTSSKSGSEQFDRQMPILEKMEMSETVSSQLDTSMSSESESRAKVPTHLAVEDHIEMDEKIAEPPLISPIYPSNTQHAASFSSITAGVDIGGVGENNIQIQEPDITSSDATSHYMASSEDALEDHVDSTSVTHNSQQAMGGGSLKKKAKSDLKRQLKMHGGAPSKKRSRVGQKIQKPRPKHEGAQHSAAGDKQVPVNEDGITEAVIGPDCVVNFPDGSEMFGCQFCPKQCRFPNGLKLHLMLRHHVKKITIEGVNTRKWGKGLGPGDIKHRKKPKVKKPEDGDNVENKGKKGKGTTEKKDKGPSEKKHKVHEDEKVPSDEKVRTDERGPIDEKVQLKLKDPVEEKNSQNEAGKAPPVKRRSPKNSTKGVFQCHLCNRTFMYETWRQKHLLRHKAKASQEMFVCSDCPRRFVTDGDLTKHKLTHRAKEQELSESDINVPNEAQGDAVELETKSDQNESALNLAAETSEAQPTNSVPVASSTQNNISSPVKSSFSLTSSSESTDGREKVSSDDRDSTKRRNITNRKGHLKKVASCSICGIEFVSSSNLHRHLRKRHGLDLVRKGGLKSSGESDTVKTETSGSEEKEEIPISPRPEIVSKPLTQESLLNVPKVNPTQSKGHMKTMANMTRMIRRKHANAVLQSMMKDRKMGGEESGEDQSRMRAKLHALLRHGKNAKRKQGFKRIEQVASLTGTLQTPTEIPNQICPWQSSVKPQPFVPKKPPTPEETPLSPVPSTSNMEVLDLRVKKPRTNNSENQNSIPYVQGDSSQPLDLSCHSRPVVHVPSYKATRRPPPKSPVATSPPPEFKTITRFNITPRMKSTGWKSSTLSAPIESGDVERPTKFSILDAAITCNVCELPFDSMKLLTQHVVAHAEDYPYKCEFCVKLFETTDMLASHRYNLHRVGKMYCCSKCQQEFAYLSNLKQHQAHIHSDIMCSYTERGPEEIRPQNFTDPTKAIQTPPILPEPRERISLIAHEMSKLSPSKFGRFSSTQPPETKSTPGKKSKKKKDVPCNPQRHHPFAYAREIGYLSTLPNGGVSSGKSVSHYEMATNNRCTKCSKVFASTADLHVHIMECAAASAVKPKTPLKTPVKTPVKTQVKTPVKAAAEKKKILQEESKQKNAKARRIKMQAAKRSRNRAIQKASESEESDAAQKRKRARPGLKMYNPLNHTRRRASANIEDVHSCQGCGKQFHFINGLERHMRLCPNKDKLFNKSANPHYAPKNMNHQCAYCARQFVYLRSLKKHISSCPTRPKDAPTSVPSLIVSLAAAATAASTMPITVSSSLSTATTVTSSSSQPSAHPNNDTNTKDIGPKTSSPKGSTHELKNPVIENKTGIPVVTTKDNCDSLKDGVHSAVQTHDRSSVTPRKARRRRRRLDPYGKKKKRSGSPRSKQSLQVEMEAEDEEDDNEEDEEEEEEDRHVEDVERKIDAGNSVQKKNIAISEIEENNEEATDSMKHEKLDAGQDKTNFGNAQENLGADTNLEDAKTDKFECKKKSNMDSIEGKTAIEEAIYTDSCNGASNR